MIKKIIIQSIDMIKCPINNKYVLVSNCCYCKLNTSESDNHYIYCKYKE